MAVSFNGITKRITISGLSNFSIVEVEKDLYSSWKNWVITDNNAKYQQAFRPIGGDPIGGTQTVPPYFFLLNNWKVDFSTMENIGFDTNLYCEESSNITTNPFIISGNGSAISKTSDAPVNTIQISSISQEMEYDGAIHIDVINGSPGSSYPIGTRAEPVNNLADALIIADGYKINDFYIGSDLTLDQNVTGKNFIGSGAAIIDLNNQLTNGSTFRTAEITGRQNSNFCVYINCRLNGITNFAGTMTGCFFQSLTPMTIQSYIPCVISDCRSAIAGNNSPIFDFSAGNIDCSVRAYSGGLRITNSTSAANVSTIEYIAGKFNFGVENTAGYFAVRGVIDTTGIDFMAGATISYTGSVTTNRELEYNEEIHLETDSSTTGSVYPFGLPGNPVNNLADALILSNKYNAHIIHLGGSLTITSGQDISNKTIKAERSLNNIVVVESGVITNGTYFTNLTISGTMNGSVRYTTCVLGEINNFDGGAKDCLLTNNINISGTGSNYLTNCDVYMTSSSSPININVGSRTLNIIKCRGGYNITNKTSIDTLAIDLIAGIVLIDTTCISGSIFLRGNCSVVDNSSVGCIVQIDSLSNETISDTVWGEQTSEHTDAGTTGLALGTASSGGVDVNVLAAAVWNHSDGNDVHQSVVGKAIITPQGDDTKIVNVYDTNGSTILYSFTVSADNNQRIPI